MDARAPRSPFPGPPFPDGRADVPPYPVRLSDPGEIAAGLPHLLGFAPTESVVLISLSGGSGSRIGLTVRGDLPPARYAAAVARRLTGALLTDDPAAAVVAVVSEAPDEPEGDEPGAEHPELPHRGLLHEIVLALAAADVPVRTALLVRRGRWWSYDCPHPCCGPAAGTPLPAEVTALEVAAVAGGTVTAPDREGLEARIARPDDCAAAAMGEAIGQVGDRCARAAAADPDGQARRSWDAVLRVLRRCRPGAAGSGGLADRDVADVLWALADVRVRDRALGLTLGEDAVAAETLWTECTRRAPAPLDAAPATLLAVSVWLRGDGAMANVALGRALESRPAYRFAQLLAEGLAACLRPEDLRAMITAATVDPDESWPPR